MKRIRPGTNFVIFLLFFGVAMLESFQSKNWPNAAFWFIIAIFFLFADNITNFRKSNNS
jgi:hypothetical protein